jgi:hypothetical protein
MRPPEERLFGAQLHRYIEDKLYWTLHAPRQTGKTTFLQNWMREINAAARACACYVSVERCQGISDVKRAIPNICAAIQAFAGDVAGVPVPECAKTLPDSMLNATLRNWAEQAAPKPLIVLFDEVDVLEGKALISFLRQLRDGFASRGVGIFPTSIALVGMRDLKDYITASKEGIAPNPGLPFNVKADSAVIGNFVCGDVARLFAQRTAETGQQITTEALGYVWEQSRGQPWIVNNLFMRATMRVLDVSSTEMVNIEHVRAARQQMIEARETHLDALGKRLEDPRVKKIIQAVITGENNPLGREDSEMEYTMDLGLIRWDKTKGFKISNPVYEEILTRILNSKYHDSVPPLLTFRWQKSDGSLDMDALLKEFQKFWRRHSEVWEQTSNYTEAFPHLLLMGFLQRITNGDGRIEREYAAGRGRLDLLVEYAAQKFIIEIKLVHDYDTLAIVREEGLEQVVSYRDKITGSPPSYLIVFDRRAAGKKLPWGERIIWETVNGVTVIGC